MSQSLYVACRHVGRSLFLCCLLSNMVVNGEEGNETPHEKWFSRKPDFSNMHIFGQDCFYPVSHSNKFSPKSTKGSFVGYTDSSKIIRVYDSNLKKVIFITD